MSVQEVLPVRITDWQRNFAANETRTVERDRLASSLTSRVRALVFTDQSGTLFLEETDNRGGAWTAIGTPLAVAPNALAEFPWTNLSKRWFRWRYVNGATAQNEFIVWEDKGGRPMADTQVTGATFAKASGSAQPSEMAVIGALSLGGSLVRSLYTGDADNASGINFLGTTSMAVNGAGNMDRWRNNVEGPLHTSTARTTGTPSPDQTLFNGCGVDIIIDVTTIGPAPSVTFTIEVKDPTSGKYVAVLASPAIVAIGTYRMVVYPGIAAVANKAANDRVRRTWRLTPVHTNVDTITYSTSKCDLV